MIKSITYIFVQIYVPNLRKKWYNEGIEQGSTTKAKEIAKSMLNKKMDINLISELTNLSIDEVKT